MITRKSSSARATIAVAVTAFTALALFGGGCKSSDEAANQATDAAATASAASAPAAPAVSPQVQAQIDAFRQADAQQRATHKPGQVAPPNLPGH